MEIKRDAYLQQLIERKDNGMIKVITGIRRCGKSFLLFTIFKRYLLENGIDVDHIIEIALGVFLICMQWTVFLRKILLSIPNHFTRMMLIQKKQKEKILLILLSIFKNQKTAGFPVVFLSVFFLFVIHLHDAVCFNHCSRN